MFKVDKEMAHWFQDKQLWRDRTGVYYWDVLRVYPARKKCYVNDQIRALAQADYAERLRKPRYYIQFVKTHCSKQIQAYCLAHLSERI